MSMDRELSAAVRTKRRKKFWIRITSGVLFFTLAILLIRAVLRPSIPRDELVLARVENGEMLATVAASGNVRPEFEEIRTSPIGSAILSIHRNLGYAVSPGDTILVLDTRDLQTQLSNMKDELALRRNNVEKLKLQLEKNLIDLQTESRIKELHVESLENELKQEEYLDSIGGGTREKIENARLSLRIARLELEQLRQTIENREKSMAADLTGLNYEISIQAKKVNELEDKLTRSTIIADKKGVITLIDNQIGKVVSAGAELVKIANLDSYEVEGKIPDRYSSSISPGTRIEVRLGKGEQIGGEIVSISPAITNNTVQFKVRLFEKDHPLLRPNLITDLYVITSFNDSIIRVKNGPFYRGGTKQPVFVMEGNRLMKRETRFGKSNIEYVEITEGLSPGEQIVISDLSDLEKHHEIRLK
jgi:HlyD family secretion protein